MAWDFRAAMVYGFNLTDPNMPFDWLLDAQLEGKPEVIPMIQVRPSF